MSTSNPTRFRYLPVNAGGRTIGIPLAAIRQILMWSELAESQIEAGNGDDAQPGEEIATIHLGRLLSRHAHEQGRSQIVVIDAEPQKIALMVDGVAPMKTVEPGSYYVMPAIFSAKHALFGGVIRGQDGLTLMIDPDVISKISTAAESR